MDTLTKGIAVLCVVAKVLVCRQRLFQGELRAFLDRAVRFDGSERMCALYMCIYERVGWSLPSHCDAITG